MLGLPGKLGPEHGILGGHTNWAGVQMALSHHCAAHDDQRGRAEAELVGTEQGRHDHIEARPQLAIGLEHNSKRVIAISQRILRIFLNPISLVKMAL